jgi:hypothetical protein
MSATEVWASWRIYMMVATLVVVIAASLLIFILATARGILRDAVRALTAAETIRKNTLPIWGLETTNDVAVEIRDTVRAIEAKGGALAGALQGKSVAVKR